MRIDSIYKLNWNKVSFFAKLALLYKSTANVKQKQSGDIKKGCAYLALASAQYNIAGTAFAHLRKVFTKPLWLFPVRTISFLCAWLPLGVWCYFRMFFASKKAVQFISDKNLTANQCDVLQSILRKLGYLSGAERYINIGLKKNEISPHTLGLLHVGLAEIHKNKGNWRKAEYHVQEALKAAKKCENIKPKQSARIYRHCADLTDFFEMSDPIPGNQLRQKAKDLAKQTDSKDQLLKI